MPKTYDPQEKEPELIDRWMSAGCYQRSKGVGDCTVVIPPPNVTGILHMNLLPDLKIFLFCGETLHHTTVGKLRKRFPGAIVANTYGPTESTVAVTYCEIDDAALADDATLPVGRARPGTELRIIDHETNEVLPIGETGEIVICGDTVAKGYYENPEKTAEAFFTSAMKPPIIQVSCIAFPLGVIQWTFHKSINPFIWLK